MQTNKTTYYQLILDQSGSMTTCKNAAIDGFNNQLGSIQSMKAEYPEQNFYVSLTKFSDEPEHLFIDRAVDELIKLNEENYTPRGCTALLDAIGECLMRLKTDKRKEFEEDKATAVVVIITDGFENASKYFSQTSISRLIADLSATDVFSISFIGATIESIQQAENIGIQRNDIVHFDCDAIEEPLEKLSASFNCYAAAKRQGRKTKHLFAVKDTIARSDQKS